MALLPISIFKMSAGVNEAVPIGLMSLFICLGAYAYAAVKKDRSVALVSAIGFFAVVTGSNYAPVMTIPFGAFMFLQALDYYLRNKPLGEFIEISAYPFAGLVLGAFVNGFDTTGSVLAGIQGLFGGYLLTAVAGFAAAAAIYFLSEKVSIAPKKRLGLVAVGAIIAALLVVATPLGGIAKHMVSDYVGAAQFNFPLDRTIAEQNQAGTNFEGEGGFFALVPASHITAGATDIGTVISNVFYGALGIVSSLFTAIGNLMFRLIDMFFNTVFGTSINTGQKDDSLLFVFILLFTFGMLAGHFARKDGDREVPSIMLLALLFVFPVLYVGINKIKFTIFAGIMTALAACMGIAALEWLLLKVSEKKESAKMHIRNAFIALVAFMIIAQVFIPYGYAVVVLSKSFTPRYQDNPSGMMPALASMCEQLKALGHYDADICAAGYEANWSDSLNNQYNSKVCLVSQLTMDDLVPGNSTEAQARSSFDRAAASFRCNRLSDYWVDSMEWIDSNLASSDRVTSWWDYGHWINYLGERKTVLRNEHASREMIGEIAHDYIDGTPSELAASMNHFDSRYALFDVELIGGTTFGGKYGALNYLSCAHDNLTSVAQQPGASDCELEHSPERILISKVQTTGTTCVISESQMRTGTLAFPVTKTGIDYANPAYCVGDVTLKGGQKISGTYYLNRKDANGDLVLSKGFIRITDEQESAAVAEMVYDDSQVWPGPNGTWVSGMDDAKTKFYTSNLYQAFYLGKLAGFDLVYKSANGEVKIFRMKDSLFTGNKEGTGGIPGIKKLEQGN
ncbi:Uncharacterised protein [uncultured archaeon]|nr:Uncharacterised protein [uncultured archaeon]